MVNMVELVYTDRWNNFQFRPPTYLDGHFEPNVYDLVKWEENNPPIETIDLSTGQKKISKEYCFSVGSLIWDAKEGGFSFESCGMRYFDNHVNGLEKWIAEFAEKITQIKTSEVGE